MSNTNKVYEYLNSLPLTADEKAKVIGQGYDSAASFYGVIKAVDAQILTNWLGRDCRMELLAALEKILTPEELVYLNVPVDTGSMGLGAVLPDESKS